MQPRFVLWMLVSLAAVLAGVGFLVWLLLSLSTGDEALQLSARADRWDIGEYAIYAAGIITLGLTVPLATFRAATLTTLLVVDGHTLTIEKSAFWLRRTRRVPLSLVEKVLIVNPRSHRPRSMLDYAAAGKRVLLIRGAKSIEYVGHGLRDRDLSWLANVLRELAR